MAHPMTVVDLRQYTLHPGRRDRLIEIFDEFLVEGQEATGMQLVGQFRDLDRPDRFVWLRGFRDLPARKQALEDFYGGPVWKAHSAAANATMVDSDDALLLRPVRVTAGYPDPGTPRPPVGATGVPGSVVAGAVYHRRSLQDGLLALFDTEIAPALRDSGAAPVAWFESVVTENNFPALPLRDEIVLAWFAVLPDDTEYDAHRHALDRSQAWQRKIAPEIERRSVKPVQDLRLRPTARSQLR
jgi:quinol monooxygenase YgiN